MPHKAKNTDLKPYLTQHHAFAPWKDLCVNGPSGPTTLERQQLPCSQLLHLLEGLGAAAQRVQYCWGLSLHALDSPSVFGNLSRPDKKQTLRPDYLRKKKLLRQSRTLWWKLLWRCDPLWKRNLCVMSKHIQRQHTKMFIFFGVRVKLLKNTWLHILDWHSSALFVFAVSAGRSPWSRLSLWGCQQVVCHFLWPRMCMCLSHLWV